MSTIAIVATCDTKYHEVCFVRDLIQKAGHTPLVVDTSVGARLEMTGDITREEVLRYGGFKPEEIIGVYSKSDGVEAMAKSVRNAVWDLFASHRIDGVFGMGGLQNTIICSSAFRTLPIGFPKLIVSTVASGFKYFDSIVGTKDITVVPSIVDFCGINVISEPILTNAVAAVIGMVEHGGARINTQGHYIIGTTLMGITNDTAVAASGKLEQDGYEFLSFHSTGGGGRVMEEMIADGHIKAVMDISLHEMVAEYFGNYGFCRGAKDRLLAGARAGIPMLVCPGAIDCISLTPDEFLEDQEQRGYVWHNSGLTHTRLYEHEILDVARVIAERLNQATGEVVLLLPLGGGLRTLSNEGEPFYAPDTMRKMKELFEKELKPEIRLKCYPHNFIDPDFGVIIAEETEALLARNGYTAPGLDKEV